MRILLRFFIYRLLLHLHPSSRTSPLSWFSIARLISETSYFQTYSLIYPKPVPRSFENGKLQ
jgi:hypothetical protein